MKKLSLLLVALLLFSFSKAHADSLKWSLPYGIGTVQLPWQSTEILAGESIRFQRPITGVSLPVLTLGRLSGGERIIDGQVGATAVFGTQGDTIQPYVALGHDIIQDLPYLNQYSSVHLNLWGGIALDKGPALGNQLDYGVSLSYSFKAS